MGIYAVFDTVGIQSYIFSSNKLGENVGASKLVRDLLHEILPSVVEGNGGITDWKNRLNKPLDTGSPCEIVYYGGGNAYVAFKDESVFEAVSKELLYKAYESTHSVGVAVAAVETDFGGNYKAEYKRLNDRLRIAKGSINRPIPAGSQPITRASTRTGMPVAGLNNEEWIDQAQILKRAADAKLRETARRKEHDELGSMIGIVHVDGNNMGDGIKSYIADADTYERAVPRMRTLSKKIDDAFSAARNAVNAKCPLLNTLVDDGDDTTVVLPGFQAIGYAAALLREIEKQPSPFEDPGANLAACAGVAIVHSHFPFSSAYTIAEEACGNAKRLSRKHPGSYIDFHLHQSGLVLELSELRKRQYTVGGKARYARPWRVSKGEAAGVPDFEWFEKRQRIWSRESRSWPRNRLKDLRNALSISNEEALMVLAQCASRGYKLLDFDMGKHPGATAADMEKLSWYFDVLELADAYAEVK
jgi:hypothetical protein